ncbi:MAG: DUF6020 family protein [Lachnospiraceae bacterium]|nr:DUF6020 family protein [Lachnospiraceae bacterium]
MKRIFEDNPVRKIVMLTVFSFVASFMFFAGNAFDTLDVVSLFSIGIIGKYVLYAVLIWLVCFLLIVLYKLVEAKAQTFFNNRSFSEPKTWQVVVFPLICYVLSWMSIFPGIFSYDCWQEWQMMVTGKLTSHHPVLHVLLAGGLSKLSNDWFGNGNAGIALYVALQIAFLLAVLVKIFAYMRKLKVKPIYQWLALIFMCLSPMINLYNIVVSKDSLFAIFALLFIFECVKVHNENDYLKSPKAIISFILSALGTMIFRNNGLYVVALSLVFLLIINKREWKRLLGSYLIIAAIYFVYVGPFYSLLNVQPSSQRELYSVPIQQLARVNRFNHEDLSQEDLDIMYKVIKEQNWNAYIPTCADAVKNGFDDEAFAIYKKDFLKVWLRQGIKHPVGYVNAFLVNTVDFWYPLSCNDSYDWLYGKDPDTGDFLDYRVAEPGVEVVIIKPLHDLYYYFATDLTVTTKVLPAMLLNPGFYLLLWLAILSYDIANKNKSRSMIHVVLLWTFATVMLGPMVQVRYLVILYYVFPLWFIGTKKTLKTL